MFYNPNHLQVLPVSCLTITFFKNLMATPMHTSEFYFSSCLSSLKNVLLWNLGSGTQFSNWTRSWMLCHETIFLLNSNIKNGEFFLSGLWGNGSQESGDYCSGSGVQSLGALRSWNRFCNEVSFKKIEQQEVQSFTHTLSVKIQA